MQDVAQDAVILRAAAQELEEYLLSTSLFWQLSSPDLGVLWRDVTPLTPGNLLLTIARLEAWQQAGFQLDDKTMKSMSFCQQKRDQWKIAWRKKTAQEWKQRLNLWKRYLAAWWQDNPSIFPADYGYHVRQRVILQLLIADGGVDALDKDGNLQLLDEALRQRIPAGEFIWPEVLRARFSLPEYWFLYVKSVGKD
jgi:hypothetical protein